jgi:RecB family endonuclease NucS
VALVTFRMPAEIADALAINVYPGMDQYESRILRAWVERHGREYTELRFNERLGAGVVLPETFTAKEREDWARRTKARPDCIAWRDPNLATVIEAKQQATNETVWQVNGYVELYAKDFPGHQVRAVIVAGAATPNARILASSQGVEMFIYTFPANAPLAPGEEEPRS